MQAVQLSISINLGLRSTVTINRAENSIHEHIVYIQSIDRVAEATRLVLQLFLNKICGGKALLTPHQSSGSKLAGLHNKDTSFFFC
jgi:hypothetical protein